MMPLTCISKFTVFVKVDTYWFLSKIEKYKYVNPVLVFDPETLYLIFIILNISICHLQN